MDWIVEIPLNRYPFGIDMYILMCLRQATKAPNQAGIHDNKDLLSLKPHNETSKPYLETRPERLPQKTHERAMAT
jgi:hypothetical protein